MDSQSQQVALVRMTQQDTLGQKTSRDVILASSYGAGRIVNELFESAGEKLGKKLDTFAMKTGWGPTEATKQIRKMLGEGDARKQSLNNLYAAFGEEAHGHCCDFSDLQKACRNLMKYTLPKESCGTQVTAFKGIVELTTHYPHLRSIILRSNDLETPDKKSAALKRWRRPGNVDDREWNFFSELAATCISDGDMTKTVETTSPREAGLITSKDGGLVEYLVRKINCCAHYEISCAVGVRYLGGVLESSSFWQEIDLEPRQYTVQKLFNVATRLSKDSGIEHEAPEDPNAEQFSDVEGVDTLICVIMVGVKEWLGPRPSQYLEEQYWSADFKELFQLLIVNNTRILLPKSRVRAIQDFKCFIEYREENVSRPTGAYGETRPPENAHEEEKTHHSTGGHEEEGHGSDSELKSIPKFTEWAFGWAKVINERSLTRNDLIVLIMGPTGVGKSTFIKCASQRNDVKIGHGLRRETDDIYLFKAKWTIRGQSIIFVDTPGFGDTYGDDMEVLDKISELLKTIYKRKIELAGLIYMHRISDNRIGNTALSNLDLFSRLYGDTAVSAITVVTTMWSQVPEEIGSRQEAELRFKSPILAKATFRRFDGTFKSACNIIYERVQGQPLPILQIQREMVDGKRKRKLGTTLRKNRAFL